MVMHSGSDAGENAFAYFSPDREHGAAIFVNGANGWVIITRIIEAIGDEPLLADYYRGLLQTVMGRSMPAWNSGTASYREETSLLSAEPDGQAIRSSGPNPSPGSATGALR